MRRALRLAALAAALAALGCQKPAGSCSQTSDCAAGESCDGGVCVKVGCGAGGCGGGSGGGLDPSGFTSVTWSTLQGLTGTTFHVDAVGADASSGDVVVSGALEGGFTPWGLSTGAFTARLSGANGSWEWATAFPDFSHGKLRTAVLASGDVAFAATLFDPTMLGTFVFTPPPQGALIVGRLSAADGSPLWASEIDATSAALVPVALSARGDDLLVAGTGAGGFGCGSGDTAAATFAALLSGADGTCVWSRGFATRSLADVEPRDAGDLAVAGVCAPTGAFFDPGGSTTCAKGLWVAALSAADGTTEWARTSTGSGNVTALRDVAVAPDGTITVVGDANGAVSFGGATVDFGTSDGSFAMSYGPTGTPGRLVRPIEAPLAPLPDAASFVRCAVDRLGKLWLAGKYLGQPTVGGLKFNACRPPSCEAATFLARVDPATGNVSPSGSFLPMMISTVAAGAYADDLVLHATTGTLAHALRFTGSTRVGGATWTSAGDADLGVLRIVP